MQELINGLIISLYFIAMPVVAMLIQGITYQLSFKRINLYKIMNDNLLK